MKKVLVTGAAGAIGINVIKYLLSEGKYEITALDLREKNSQRILKKYRRRINLVYGDMNDQVLMDSLVKGHDFIIHLAGVMPPLADIKKNLAEMVDYQGTSNIIEAIKNYNPKCFMVYASSTTVYGDVNTANVRQKPNIHNLDYYSNTKLKVEKLIQNSLKHYTIIRLPLVLCNPKTGAFMYNGRKNSMTEAITDNDAGYLMASTLLYTDKLNKKVFNATDGDDAKDYYGNILAKVLKLYGLNIKYLTNLLFVDKNFYTHIYSDSDKLADIIPFRSDSLSSYYMRLKREVKGRFISRLLAKPIAFFLKRKNK